MTWGVSSGEALIDVHLTLYSRNCRLQILVRRLERSDALKVGGSRAARFPSLSGRMRQVFGTKLADLLQTHGVCRRE